MLFIAVNCSALYLLMCHWCK